jgi:peptide/nickel transport system permease protein
VRTFLLGRALQALVVIAVVTTLTFVLIHLAPGDPFASLDDPRVSQAVRQRWRADLGLDRPLPEQFVRYIGNVARGRLGWSVSRSQPVSTVIAQAVPNTLALMGSAVLLSFLAGVALGVVQAIWDRTWLARILGGVSLVFYSMPDFWLALMAMLLLAYKLSLFPITGTIDAVLYPYMSSWERFVDRTYHLALPALTLTALSSAAIARYQRSAMLDVVHEDYVRTARAKGVPERGVIVKHALRNALLPVITLLGLSFPALLGGAVFIERVFAWPGMGMVAVNAISQRDYELVTATVIVGSAMVALGSLIADLLYAAADPRLRDV